ncbi:MAG: CBS domain-containing protein [Nitrososphaeraceae archaeon]
MKTSLYSNKYSDLKNKVLEFSKEGRPVNDFRDELQISKHGLRRLMTELIDKGLLKYDFSAKIYITTDKGINFLRKSESKADDLINASDIAKRIISLDPKRTIFDARNTMLRYNISRIIISSNNNIVGILTEKDIASFLYNMDERKKLSEVSLSEVMNKNIISVSSTTLVNTCAKKMLEDGISSLIVVDQQKRGVGILTKSDLIELYSHNFQGKNKVTDFMTKKVWTVDMDEPIHMVIMMLSNHAISRLVVIQNKRPVGIITNKDLLPVSPLITGKVHKYVKKNNSNRAIPSLARSIVLAEDIMTRYLLLVRENSDLADTARIMIRHGISGLPVIDKGEKLTGIITKSDIIRAFSV